MSDNLTIARADMLAVADAVAREKAIDRELVLEAMEQAIQKAGRSKYGLEHDIRATIDRKSGEITLARYIEVVDPKDLIDEQTQIPLSDAQRKDPSLEVGAFIIDRLPPIDFGRIAAQTAKQVIVQRVREAERERQYEEYKDKAGQIVTGIIKRVEHGNVTVDLGRAEAYLRRDEIIPREKLNRGDRVRAYITEVRRETRGPQILLSRTRPTFMALLFAQEVPEVYDGVIEIRRVARDPGSRAKIAVITNDSSIDPVGACVGMRGSRVQAVVNELQGEKIDIITWTENTADFVIQALAPAVVTKVFLDEDNKSVDVVAQEDSHSKAIGRRGQNVRLASMLTGWSINIMTEAEESEKRQQESREISERLMAALDVDDVIARLLATEGFRSLEEVAYVDPSEMTSIEGFDLELVQELQLRATSWLEAEEKRLLEKLDILKVAADLRAVEGFTKEMLITLGENGVRTVEDLAGLAADELVDKTDGILRDFSLDHRGVEQLVLRARVAVGWLSEEDLEEALAKSEEDSQVEPDMADVSGVNPKAAASAAFKDTEQVFGR